MKRKLMLGIAALIVAVYVGVQYWLGMPSGPVPVGAATPPPSGEGWIDLLAPAKAAQWKNLGDDKDIFEIKDAMLHIYGVTLLPLRYATYTGEKFTDFELHVEFKVEPGTNSGLFLRTQPNDPVARGFEVQVIDDFGDVPTKNSCASIYDVVSPMFNLSRPAGEWNSYDIVVRGTSVIIHHNGWKVIDTDFAKMTSPLGKFKIPYAEMVREGNIAIQDHGGECWYRNILVRKL